MSVAVRTAIATAVNTVDGIECSPYFVSTTAAGAAMVRLDRIEYPNTFGGICHWNVVLLLPQDQAAAEAYLEEKVPLIVAALHNEELVVTQVQPQRLEITGVGILPCVFINGHREQE